MAVKSIILFANINCYLITFEIRCRRKSQCNYFVTILMNEFIHNLFKSFDSFHQFSKSGSHSNVCVSCTKFSIVILFASIRLWSQKDFFYATKVFFEHFKSGIFIFSLRQKCLTIFKLKKSLRKDMMVSIYENSFILIIHVSLLVKSFQFIFRTLTLYS